MSNFIKLISCVVLSLALSACGLLSPAKIPPVKSYVIANLHPKVTPTKKRSNLTLLVNTPMASPGYQSNRMIYVTVPYKLKAFANSHWVAAPAQMILPLLAEQLYATGYFHAVVTPPFTGVANYRLSTKLLELQQEFLKPTSQIRLLMEAMLISNTNNKVIASRRFQVIVNAKENNPYGGVLATNRAVNKINAQITRFVLRNLRRR